MRSISVRLLCGSFASLAMLVGCGAGQSVAKSDPALAKDEAPATAGKPVASVPPEVPTLEPIATAPLEDDICKPGAPASQSDVWGQLPAPPSEWVSCERDQDCALAEIGCCDHCNGGRRVVVNSRFTKQASAKYGVKQCKGNCTEKACAPRVVLCSEHQCTDASAPVCDERAQSVLEKR